MNHAFTVCYNNGMSYEDHGWDVVCVAPNRSAADAEVKRLDAWLARTRKRIPEVPSTPPGPDPLPDTKEGKRWLRLHDANARAVMRARMPYGCEAIRHSLHQKDEGHFFVEKKVML